jgi:hypothetical protein
MTVPELIDQVLQSIARDFYGEDRVREFMRDRLALTRAVARYGYTCTQRGWSFDVPHILKEVMTVLISMRDKQAAIHWLPKYLEGAIDRHIRQRAEELSALAKTRDRQNITKKVQTLTKVEAVREQSATEILSTLYKDLKRSSRRQKAVPKSQQKDLF